MLKIYGETHYGNDEDEKSRDVIKANADKGEIILFHEGIYHSEERDNHYGIEEPWVFDLGVTLSTYLTFKHMMSVYKTNLRLTSDVGILKYLGAIAQAGKGGVFCHVIGNYAKNALTLNTSSHTRDLIRSGLIRHNIKEPFEKLCAEHNKLLADVSISIKGKKFTKQFFESFFSISEKLELVIKEMCPLLLEQVRSIHAARANLEILTPAALEAAFAITTKEAWDNNIFRAEININIRNQVFIDNLHRVITKRGVKGEYAFIVGTAHLVGLKTLIENDLRFKTSGIKIEFVTKTKITEETIAPPPSTTSAAKQQPQLSSGVAEIVAKVGVSRVASKEETTSSTSSSQNNNVPISNTPTA